jgi:cell division protein ZapA (FtsZ GTPase activity inhibitor)
VLAAVNIALDYLQLKEKGQGKTEDISAQLEELEATLSNALKN